MNFCMRFEGQQIPMTGIKGARLIRWLKPGETDVGALFLAPEDNGQPTLSGISEDTRKRIAKATSQLPWKPMPIFERMIVFTATWYRDIQSSYKLADLINAYIARYAGNLP